MFHDAWSKHCCINGDNFDVVIYGWEFAHEHISCDRTRFAWRLAMIDRWFNIPPQANGIVLNLELDLFNCCRLALESSLVEMLAIWFMGRNILDIFYKLLTLTNVMVINLCIFFAGMKNRISNKIYDTNVVMPNTNARVSQ